MENGKIDSTIEAATIISRAIKTGGASRIRFDQRVNGIAIVKVYPDFSNTWMSVYDNFKIRLPENDLEPGGSYEFNSFGQVVEFGIWYIGAIEKIIELNGGSNHKELLKTSAKEKYVAIMEKLKQEKRLKLILRDFKLNDSDSETTIKRIFELFGEETVKYYSEDFPFDRGSCEECGEGYDNEKEWKYNTHCAVCHTPIPKHLIIKNPKDVKRSSSTRNL